jgi:hypothetical protein
MSRGPWSLQSLAGRFLFFCRRLIAAGLARVPYLATVATQAWLTTLPPGEYDTIEEAQRAADSISPHARDPAAGVCSRSPSAVRSTASSAKAGCGHR